jgi:hypothetical protein
MYFDSKPCRVCGSEVDLRARESERVNEPDATVDERVCTNPDCETNTRGSATECATSWLQSSGGAPS